MMGVVLLSYKAHKVQKPICGTLEIYKTTTKSSYIPTHIYFSDFIILAKAKQKIYKQIRL